MSRLFRDGNQLHFLVFVVLVLFILLQVYILTRPGLSEPKLVSSRRTTIISSPSSVDHSTSTVLYAATISDTTTSLTPSQLNNNNTVNTPIGTQKSNSTTNNTSINKSEIIPFSDNSTLPTLWKKYSGQPWSQGFCQEFLGKTYDVTNVICRHRITCYNSQHNKKLGTCTMWGGIAVKPNPLYEVMTKLKVEDILKSKSVWLLPTAEPKTACNNPVFNDVEKYMENFDPILPIIKMASLASTTVKAQKCQRWISGTTFFYVGQAKHIYFRFLVWYNLFRSLRQHEDQRSDIHIVRLPELEGNFLFPELEKHLFGEVIPIETFQEEVVCFESVVLVSWAYGAPMFRCKMDGAKIKRKCLECDGKNRNTDLVSFRKHVLAGCSISDDDKKVDQRPKITIIERKRYERYKGDPLKKFRRIWENSKELISKLSQVFPNANVTGVYAETLPICDQIRLAHDTDILVAMHGAGLVHLWWQRDTGKIIELVPKSQRGNAAFISLAKYLGRTHKLVNKVNEKGPVVTVDVNKVVEEIKRLL